MGDKEFAACTYIGKGKVWLILSAVLYIEIIVVVDDGGGSAIVFTFLQNEWMQATKKLANSQWFDFS